MTTVALLIGVGLMIGLVTTLSLRASLMNQVDNQLGSSADRARLRSGEPPPSTPSIDFPAVSGCSGATPRVLRGPGQGPGYLTARFENGTLNPVESAVLDEKGGSEDCPIPLTDAQAKALQRVGENGYQTLQLPGLGSYRLSAMSIDGGVVLVTGLPLTEQNRTLLTVVGVELGVILLGVAAAAFAGSLLIRRDLAPLERVAATATRVSELELDRGAVDLAERVPVTDTDHSSEVGRVGSALNRMLDHVGSALAARHESEQRVRQFVADASHELRTPLAAIRGYSELTRRSRDEVPADVLHAMGRVESEALRMTGLVEDLLLLARLDAGRALEREPVDLTMTVLDAVSDARVAGPEHTWRLAIPDDVVEVVGDPGRLHQVLVNLLANARTHTPAGTEVTVRISTDAGGRQCGSARLEVVDNGPGIPPDLLPHVFERFARGDSSRSRAAGSTGLGLAIVQAVVASHHGSVTVSSRPGRTAFTISLPTR